jgi:8-oxo-dGTP diphosphatase
MVDKRFIIRVYAIIVNERKEVLLSDEYVRDTYITKFPGGGLSWGEGLLDCLMREAEEEFGQPVEIGSHFYTDESFRKALFYEGSQLISVYYLAAFKEAIRFRISERAFDFSERSNGSQSFRWIAIDSITPDMMTLPTDKKVARLLKKSFRSGKSGNSKI